MAFLASFFSNAHQAAARIVETRETEQTRKKIEATSNLVEIVSLIIGVTNAAFALLALINGGYVALFFAPICATLSAFSFDVYTASREASRLSRSAANFTFLNTGVREVINRGTLGLIEKIVKDTFFLKPIFNAVKASWEAEQL